MFSANSVIAFKEEDIGGRGMRGSLSQECFKQVLCNALALSRLWKLLFCPGESKTECWKDVRIQSSRAEVAGAGYFGRSEGSFFPPRVPLVPPEHLETDAT